MKKKPIRERLDEIIHELIMDYSGDEIEVEMIRSCSLTNISLVLREKQIQANKELDRINQYNEQ